MLRSANRLRAYSIRAHDGQIGQADDFLFDDLSWAVRYLVVNTGNWLMGRKVLMSSAAIEQPDRKAEELVVNATKQQIENSPPLAADKPVSRQNETELNSYYGWPTYWTAGATSFYADTQRGQRAPAAIETPPDAETAAQTQTRHTYDPHLRSVDEVTSYHIQARDGDIGHVEDFILSDDDWTIRYMVVDTRNWLPGKDVLVSPTWIEAMAWGLREVSVDLKRETIKHSPEYDPDQPITRDYETRLHAHYDRPRYWERQ